MPPTPPPTALPDSAGSVIGSVSHLISAALETAGLYFQSDILNFAGDYLHTFAVLFFIVAAGKAIYQFVISHSLTQGLYLLIGPALFFFCIYTTIEGAPTTVRSGERVDKNAGPDQLEMLKRISSLDMYDKKPVVSFAFAKIDRLVSSVMQSMVSFLVDTENNKDLINIAREKVFSEVFSTRAVEAPYIRLINAGMVGECAELTRRNDELARLRTRVQIYKSQSHPDVNKFDKDLVELQGKINLLNNYRFPITENEREFLLNLFPSDAIGEDLTCEKAWYYIWEVAKKKAENAVETSTAGNLERRGVPWKKVKQEIDDSIGNGNSQVATKIIAAHVIKNSLQSTSLNNISNDMLTQRPVSAHFHNLIFRKVSQTEGEGYQITLQFFVGIIPYIQGVILFLLAGLFPFFCLLFLIPEKMPMAFIWISLWVWVKSWDVGFAMIHTIRELLWRMMCIRTVPNSNQVNWDKMTDVFAVINQFDPLVNISIYQMIIASLYLLVPVITAHVCTGANQLLGAFRTGIDQTAPRFTRRVANAARREYSTLIEAQMGQYEQQRAILAAEEHMRNGGPVEVNGKMVSSAKSGDGALARSGDAVYQRTIAGLWELQEQSAMDLAVMSNRGVFLNSYSSSRSGPMIQAQVNALRVVNESPDANSANSRGILASTQAPGPGVPDQNKLPNPSTSATTFSAPVPTPRE